MFLAIFDNQHSKDDVTDVIVTSLWILLLLPLRDFVSENCYATLGGNWRTNKEETEAHAPPSLYNNKIPQPK